MRCITVKQPWAWAMFHASIIKPVENRTWGRIKRKVESGPLLIHAGRRPTSKVDRYYFERSRGCIIENSVRCPGVDEMDFSGIVGVVDLVEIVDEATAIDRVSPEAQFYVNGPDCWMLENPRAFDAIVEMPGRLGVWTIPDEVVREALSSVGA